MKIQIWKVKVVLEWDEDDAVNEDDIVWLKNSGAAEKSDAIQSVASPRTGLYL